MQYLTRSVCWYVSSLVWLFIVLSVHQYVGDTFLVSLFLPNGLPQWIYSYRVMHLDFLGFWSPFAKKDDYWSLIQILLYCSLANANLKLAKPRDSIPIYILPTSAALLVTPPKNNLQSVNFYKAQHHLSWCKSAIIPNCQIASLQKITLPNSVSYKW